jgi:hypothetical protein
VLSKSAAEGEAVNAKLYADPAWAAFQTAFDADGKITSGVRLRTIDSYGDINDTDSVWVGVLLRITDVPKYLAARNRYRATETGKKFPGQVHLNAIVAGGASPATHAIHIGYASEAEWESAMQTSASSADWQTFQAEVRDISQVLGTSAHRLVKAWGAPLKDVVGR